MDSEQVSAAPKPEFLAPPTWVVPLGPNTQITTGGTKSADLRVKAPWSVRAEAIAGKALAAAEGAPTVEARLERALSEWSSSPEALGAKISLWVADVRCPADPIYTLEPDLALNPSSNSKLAAAAFAPIAARLEACADAIEAAAAGRDGGIGVPESLNTGIPIGVTAAMTGGVAGYFHGAAHFLRTRGEAEERDGRHGRVVLHRAPRGPAVVIAPWNAPSPIVVGRTAFALGAGCPVIVKPSEWAPFTADLVIEAPAAADLPAGPVQPVPGHSEVAQPPVACV